MQPYNKQATDDKVRAADAKAEYESNGGGGAPSKPAKKGKAAPVV
jgi:hypothetical protein